MWANPTLRAPCTVRLAACMLLQCAHRLHAQHSVISLRLPLLCFHSLSLFLLPPPTPRTLPPLSLSSPSLPLYPGLQCHLPLQPASLPPIPKQCGFTGKEITTQRLSLVPVVGDLLPTSTWVFPLFFLYHPPTSPPRIPHRRRVYFNLTKSERGGCKKRERNGRWRGAEKRSLHHRNIQPYQRDLLHTEI